MIPKSYIALSIAALALAAGAAPAAKPTDVASTSEQPGNGAKHAGANPGGVEIPAKDGGKDKPGKDSIAPKEPHHHPKNHDDGPRGRPKKGGDDQGEDDDCEDDMPGQGGGENHHTGNNGEGKPDQGGDGKPRKTTPSRPTPLAKQSGPALDSRAQPSHHPKDNDDGPGGHPKKGGANNLDDNDCEDDIPGQGDDDDHPAEQGPERPSKGGPRPGDDDDGKPSKGDRPSKPTKDIGLDKRASGKGDDDSKPTRSAAGKPSPSGKQAGPALEDPNIDAAAVLHPDIKMPLPKPSSKKCSKKGKAKSKGGKCGKKGKGKGKKGPKPSGGGQSAGATPIPILPNKSKSRSIDSLD